MTQTATLALTLEEVVGRCEMDELRATRVREVLASVRERYGEVPR